MTGMATWGSLDAMCLYAWSLSKQDASLGLSSLGQILWSPEMLTEGAAAGRRTC